MSKVLSNPTVVINNTPVAIIPNSFKFNEGQGEQKIRVESAGGGALNQVLADDVEMKFGAFSFEMLNTEANIESARSWKLNGNLNTVSVSEGNFDRTFAGSAIVNNYDVSLAADGNIVLEWNGQQPV
jgi:hypothetical protein